MDDDMSGWHHQQELEQQRIELDPEYRKEFEAWLDKLNQQARKQGEQNGVSSEESGK